jgi:hypothetical protein
VLGGSTFPIAFPVSSLYRLGLAASSHIHCNSEFSVPGPGGSPRRVNKNNTAAVHIPAQRRHSQFTTGHRLHLAELPRGPFIFQAPSPAQPAPRPVTPRLLRQKQKTVHPPIAIFFAFAPTRFHARIRLEWQHAGCCWTDTSAPPRNPNFGQLRKGSGGRLQSASQPNHFDATWWHW